MNYGLSYVGYPLVLEAHSGSSWINHVEDSSSTSGWVFLLGGAAISWASKKQTCITSSTMEYEFVALVAAGKKAYAKKLIHEIQSWSRPINTDFYPSVISDATLANALVKFIMVTDIYKRTKTKQNGQIRAREWNERGKTKPKP
ncbi:hypothetical protein Tco_1259342 [Tanacetum coccineum]